MIWRRGLPDRPQESEDLTLHLLQSIEVLCRRGGGLLTGPFGLVDHHPRMRKANRFPGLPPLEHDEPIEYAMPWTTIVTS